jgi:hypothetical protein
MATLFQEELPANALQKPAAFWGYRYFEFNLEFCHCEGAISICAAYYISHALNSVIQGAFAEFDQKVSRQS